MTTDYVTDADDDIPFDVNEEIEVGDLSDQQGDVIDAASRVLFSIKKASVRTQEDRDTKKWQVKRLVLEAKVSELGVDGEGLYAGKIIFGELILTFNAAEFPVKFGKEWWKTKARYPTKQFFKAMGIDITGIKVNDDFLASLIDRQFVANIQKKAITEKVGDKYEPTGEYKNELAGYRAAQVDAE